jgi:GGDEF domain-containing protein
VNGCKRLVIKREIGSRKDTSLSGGDNLLYRDIASLGVNPMPNTGKHASTISELIAHLQILIRGIALHAIEGTPEDANMFKRRQAAIADSLKEDSSTDDVLVAVGKTLRGLEDYNDRAAVVFSAQLEELRGMLSTMTATVMFITSSSETSVKQLTAIESKLRSATTLEDTREVKAFMTECMALVRAESLRLQDESRIKIHALKTAVDRLSRRLKATATEDSVDPVTGLPGRFTAEEAVAAHISAGKETLAALFVVDRIAAINGRFGRQTGDDILLHLAPLLAQKLSGGALFRWTGPAFLAVFDPSVGLIQAEARARQAAALHVEKNVDDDSGTVLIAITVSSHIQRIAAHMIPEAVFKSLDAFMAARGEDKRLL